MSVSLAFVDLDTEGMLKEGDLGVGCGYGICLGAINGLSLQGGKGGRVEVAGIGDRALFRLKAGIAEDGLVGGEDASVGSVHLLGGPGDDKLVDGLVDKHGPGVFAQVIGGDTNPGSKAGVVGVDKGGAPSVIMASMMADLMVSSSDEYQVSVAVVRRWWPLLTRVAWRAWRS
jgi:hypothetical protein